MCISKEVLRTRAREARAAIPEEKRKEYSCTICNRVVSLLDGQDPVLVYVSKPPEVETIPLITTLFSRKTSVVVPIIEREERTLRLSFLRDPSHLSISTFSVPEPIGHEFPADPGSIHVAIVPLIAYDRNGHRLGYGAGYYDRFLSRNPHMFKIGIGFSCQEVDQIPADSRDVSMDVIVTENEIIRTGEKRAVQRYSAPFM
ncbi:MAG TPA: 5-formyltetrahydrofolate cyclo-ligase [Methanolinea sp.]|jgi:5-formyltetrahydrofolate cyclo-ligase|nr:5-formyltetrahydrofolate cyclo-ligase [Methanolinea sp.]MDH7510247.1 5-formyltetrahydrofolate cyclo-ligase [Methanolinea sp.]HOS81486.1 5-formyltetrahydrofolate cyclo-ligase [Methanolinea sp.]HPC55112.1 5-formyltetrahydrofolate cyclo-ligase [Methanolinea sp.]HQE85645.1 5-formyltetrahydrofolate cyclo-ligase [Methanolinea sp.]